MIATVCQRWRDRRGSYRVVGEPIRTRLYEIARIATDREAGGFVRAHHYSGSYVAALMRVGLYRGGKLVGVAVFSQPASQAALEAVRRLSASSLAIVQQAGGTRGNPRAPISRARYAKTVGTEHDLGRAVTCSAGGCGPIRDQESPAAPRGAGVLCAAGRVIGVRQWRWTFVPFLLELVGWARPGPPRCGSSNAAMLRLRRRAGDVGRQGSSGCSELKHRRHPAK